MNEKQRFSNLTAPSRLLFIGVAAAAASVVTVAASAPAEAQSPISPIAPPPAGPGIPITPPLPIGSPAVDPATPTPPVVTPTPPVVTPTPPVVTPTPPVVTPTPPVVTPTPPVVTPTPPVVTPTPPVVTPTPPVVSPTPPVVTPPTPVSPVTPVSNLRPETLAFLQNLATARGIPLAQLTGTPVALAANNTTDPPAVLGAAVDAFNGAGIPILEGFNSDGFADIIRGRRSAAEIVRIFRGTSSGALNFILRYNRSPVGRRLGGRLLRSSTISIRYRGITLAEYLFYKNNTRIFPLQPDGREY